MPVNIGDSIASLLVPEELLLEDLPTRTSIPLVLTRYCNLAFTSDQFLEGK